MMLTFVLHVRTGTKVYYKNTHCIDASQYYEHIKDNNTKYSFITDLTEKLPPNGYPENIYDLLNYLNQYICVKNHSNNTIAYKDGTQWEMDLYR